ncbi:hypothetical protein DXV75_07980 [Alteromonas aestuariivivens]|uniref:Peptidase M56 domain-containing protein n=1 Tax=Alteromonas aestuariivivens TaxID=1938339 RepID=A0A3D8M8T6_9ALTE|nr:M56 family metallopeptidase [Alteromonas aestuariivivens]RDV26016.1 hypothetical protein DXV75_07980 [Alteromonas aestuariivivens]
MDYLLTNFATTVLMLITVKFIQEAPARLQITLLMLALLNWFIPWHDLEVSLLAPSSLLPHNIDYFLPTEMMASNTTPGQVFANISHWGNVVQNVEWFSFSHVFTGLLCLGILLFFGDVLRYLRYLDSLNKTAEDRTELLVHYNLPAKAHYLCGISVKICQGCPPAMATGVIRPTIWLNRRLLNSSQLHSVLLHEVTHLRHCDPGLKWVTQLARRVFWWNPLVIKLIERIDLLVEMSCDQHCYAVKREKYSQDLAAIILQSHSGTSNQAAQISGFTSIHSQASANLLRLESLKSEKTLRLKFVALACVGTLLSSVACAQFNSSIVTDETDRLHAMALRVQAHRANQNKYSIYRPDTAKNAQFNRQMRELVALSKDALSPSHDVLNLAYSEIDAWYANRPALPAPQQREIAFHTTAVQHFLLQQQNRQSDYLDLVTQRFGAPEKVPVPLRYSTAAALIKLHRYENALEILQQFDLASPKTALGNFILAVEACMKQGKYEQALWLVNNRVVRNNTSEEIRLLKLRFNVLTTAGQTGPAEQIRADLANHYGVEKIPPQNFNGPALRVQWAPVLDHI